MGCAPDEAVEVACFDVEIDVQTMDGRPEDVVSENAALHFLLNLRVGVLRSVTRDAGGVPRDVTVLVAADQDYLSEVSEVPRFAQLIEVCLSGVASLLHGELL